MTAGSPTAAATTRRGDHQRRRPLHRTRRPQATDALTSKSAAWNREEGETKGKRSYRERTRSEEKNKIKINCCLCVVSLVAGDGGPHRQRRKTEKKKTFPIHQFATFIGGGAWVPSAAAREPTRRPLFLWPRSLPALFPWLHCSWFYSGGCFCNFKLFNVIFVYFWIFIICSVGVKKKKEKI